MFAILCIFPLPRNSFVWYSVIYDGVFRVRAYDQIYWQHILAGLFCCCLLAVYLYAAVPVRSPIRRTRTTLPPIIWTQNVWPSNCSSPVHPRCDGCTAVSCCIMLLLLLYSSPSCSRRYVCSRSHSQVMPTELACVSLARQVVQDT